MSYHGMSLSVPWHVMSWHESQCEPSHVGLPGPELILDIPLILIRWLCVNLSLSITIRINLTRRLIRTIYLNMSICTGLNMPKTHEHDKNHDVTMTRPWNIKIFMTWPWTIKFIMIWTLKIKLTEPWPCTLTMTWTCPWPLGWDNPDDSPHHSMLRVLMYLAVEPGGRAPVSHQLGVVLALEHRPHPDLLQPLGANLSRLRVPVVSPARLPRKSIWKNIIKDYILLWGWNFLRRKKRGYRLVLN